MELNHEIVKISIIRRIGAFITDLFIVLMLFLAFNSYVFTPIFSNVFSYDENLEIYENIMLESNLYYEDSQGYIYELIQEFDNGHFKQGELNFYKKVDSSIEAFYLKYQHQGANLSSFLENKSESNLYNFSNNQYVLKENVDVNAYKTFITENFEQAVSLFSKIDEQYVSIARTFMVFQILSLSLSLIISCTIVFLLIPLFSKNSETIGKRLLSVGIVSLKDGFAIKKSQLLIRFLVFLLIEVILSVLLFAIPLLISFSMVVFNKKGLALHDYLSATICVDKKQTIVYKDFDEFLKHEKIKLN